MSRVVPALSRAALAALLQAVGTCMPCKPLQCQQAVLRAAANAGKAPFHTCSQSKQLSQTSQPVFWSRTSPPLLQARCWSAAALPQEECSSSASAAPEELSVNSHSKAAANPFPKQDWMEVTEEARPETAFAYVPDEAGEATLEQPATSGRDQVFSAANEIPGDEAAAKGESSSAEMSRASVSGSEQGDYSASEEAGPLDWSESDGEEDFAQPSGFTPYGRPMRLYGKREKKRPGKKAVIPPLPDFDRMLPRLQAYKDLYGDCLVPKRFWEDFELGDWASRVRTLLKEKKLPPRQFHVLEGMGFPWRVPMEVAEWEYYFHELRRYKALHGNINVPFKWRDPQVDFGNHFAVWYHTQPTLFLQRRLTVNQVRKLKLTGYDLAEITGDMISKADYMASQQEIARSSVKNEFEIMFAELEAWRAAYFTTVIPRMVYDNPLLGTWAWKVRQDNRNKRLPEWQVKRLDSLEFLWKVDQNTSKWHANLHEARRYKEVHGTGNIPENYENPDEPGWVEASRWLMRQAKNYRQQKLTDKRYRIISQVLGIKFVRQFGPKRRSRNHMAIRNERTQPNPKKYKKAPAIRKPKGPRQI